MSGSDLRLMFGYTLDALERGLQSSEVCFFEDNQFGAGFDSVPEGADKEL
jgi:hypothetical protein